MMIEVSMHEATKMIEEHFKNKGYFINYDDVPILFQPIKNGFGNGFCFCVQISLCENKEKSG